VTYEAVQPEAAPATTGLPEMPDPAAIDGWVVMRCSRGSRTMISYGRLRMSALGGIIVSLVILASPSAAFAAASWSPAVVISASQPSPTGSSFVVNSAGNELWVSSPPAVGGYLVQAAQRSFGGAWSPQTTIWSVTNGFISTPTNVSASIGANNSASVAWLVGGSILIAVRSSSGAWQKPVSIATSGSGAAGLVEKSDAQGNGVAAWSEFTPAGSIVEAVAWTASGAFGSVVQLSGLGQSEFLPDLAVNETGTAVVVWTQATTFGGSSYQVESATRAAGGSWSAAAAVSPVMAQASLARVALDGSGNATVVWEQGTTVDASTRPVGGAWGSPTLIETASLVGLDSVASDASGNITAAWAVNDPTNGTVSVHAATRPAGSPWAAPASLGSCTSTCVPNLAAARDGSIAVVGWSPNGPIANAAVRRGAGTWVSAIVGGSNARVTYVVAGNNAFASAVWPVGIQVKYHLALDQSDYR
jgi:hypothetical protein